MARQRYKIRVLAIQEDHVWITADSWEEAEQKAKVLDPEYLHFESFGERETCWTGDTEEIK